MTAPFTHQSEIWTALKAGMVKGEWTTIEQIYSIVEERVSLKHADLVPAAPGASDLRWRRNVRNVLQSKKGKGEIVWLSGGRYMLPLSSDPIQATSSLPMRKGLSETDFLKLQERRREIGLEGENLIVEMERMSLLDEGNPYLARMVRRVSEQDVGLGYDIVSFDREGREKYIEVKSTTSMRTTFEITQTELETARSLGKRYWLYIIRNLGADKPIISKVQDPASVFGNEITLEPSAYSASASPQIIDAGVRLA